MSNQPETGQTGSTRRQFVTAGAAAAVAGAARGAAETLAIDGGAKAVTVPDARQAAIGRWPRYGAEEKKALVELLDNNRAYDEIPLLENELKDYLKAPYVKAHCNGT